MEWNNIPLACIARDWMDEWYTRDIRKEIGQEDAVRVLSRHLVENDDVFHKPMIQQLHEITPQEIIRYPGIENSMVGWTSSSDVNRGLAVLLRLVKSYYIVMLPGRTSSQFRWTRGENNVLIRSRPCYTVLYLACSTFWKRNRCEQ